MANIPTQLTSEITSKYFVDRDNLFLKREAKSNPKDRIEIELGDSKDPSDFFPQMKLMRWDNETNASFRLKDFTNYTVETDKEKIRLVNGKKEIHFYDFTEDVSHPEGGYKYEVILKEKPLTNKLEFTIQTKGLDFFYQPPLTPEEIAEGASRPPEVTGSYAVYHKTKGGMNDAAGMEYKVGKAFHIYRPEAIDATGKWVYGDLNITVNEDGTGLMTKTFPQSFLDTATYPVLIGSPTPPVFDAATQATGATDPLTFSHTCTGADRLLVLGLAWRDDVARTGGAPTYNGVAMSQAGSTQVKAGAGGFPGASAEIWYLTNPASGANTVSIPNTPTLTIRAVASSFINAKQEQSEVLDQTGGGTGATQDPSNSITPTMNLQIIVDIMAHELNTAETARNKTLLFANDEGVWNTAAQYELQGNAALTTFTHTIGADHWAIAMASFRAKDNPTFGYTSLGASDGPSVANKAADSTAHSITDGRARTLSEAGTLDSLHAGLRAAQVTETIDIFLAVYDEDSGGVDSHGLLASVESLNASISTTAAFVNINAASESLSADQLILAALGNGEDISAASRQVKLRWDSVSAANNYNEDTSGAGGYATRKAEDPWTETLFSGNFQSSIYATYTAAGGEAAPVFWKSLLGVGFSFLLFLKLTVLKFFSII